MLFIATLLFSSSLALADSDDCATNPMGTDCPCASVDSSVCDGLTNTSGGSGSDLAGIINGYIKLALIGIGVLAVIVLIYGGIKYITSAGNKNNITSAKTVIMYGIAGLVLAISAYAIVEFVVGRL